MSTKKYRWEKRYWHRVFHGTPVCDENLVPYKKRGRVIRRLRKKGWA